MKAFIDIETGGFSISKNGVCEIAIALTDDNLNIVQEYHSLIKPYRREDSDEFVSYKEDAMEVNGIDVLDLSLEGKPVEEVMKNIFSILSSHDDICIIGHNAKSFDIPRVHYLIERFLNESIMHLDCEDTKLIAKESGHTECSLFALCDYYEIENKGAHRAMSDVYATIELYKKLTVIA